MILDALKKRLYQKKKSIRADGLKSYQLWSRDCVLKLVAAPVYLHFSWSVAQKPYYQRTLPSEHLKWKIMMKSKPQLFGQRTSTGPRRNA